MFQEEGTKSIKVLGLEEVWRPMWLHSPTHPSILLSPAFHPAVKADATGAMSQDIGFMLFSASNKILPGSNSEALVWLWWNSIFHFTLWFMGSQLAD